MRLIGLADDHPAILDALDNALSKVGSLEIAFKVRASQKLFRALEVQPCAIVVADYSMQQRVASSDGLAMVSRLLRTHPHLKLIVFTMLSNVALLRQLTQVGIHGLVSKNDEISEVLAAIHAVDAGSALPYLSPTISEWLRRSVAFGANARACLQRLSQRELEVVRLFARGEQLDAIAAILSRSKSTISTHKQNAMQKLRISNNTELIRYAYETGIA